MSATQTGGREQSAPAGIAPAWPGEEPGLFNEGRSGQLSPARLLPGRAGLRLPRAGPGLPWGPFACAPPHP